MEALLQIICEGGQLHYEQALPACTDLGILRRMGWMLDTSSLQELVTYSTLHEYMLLDDLVSATFVFLYRLRGEEWIPCRICAMDVKP
jgi:hypothetical protein